MSNLQKKLLRYEIMNKHRKLVNGSQEEMDVARNLLKFLNDGKIKLTKLWPDWQTEYLLKSLGVDFQDSEDGWEVYATIDWRV